MTKLVINFPLFQTTEFSENNFYSLKPHYKSFAKNYSKYICSVLRKVIVKDFPLPLRENGIRNLEQYLDSQNFLWIPLPHLFLKSLLQETNNIHLPESDVSHSVFPSLF